MSHLFGDNPSDSSVGQSAHVGKGLRIAIVGATGLVGTEILTVLAESGLPVASIIPVASSRSVGQVVAFKGQDYAVVDAATAISMQPDVAIFSAGGSVSTLLAPQFAAAGIRVVDNSSAWRMDPTKKLVVPEVNAEVLTEEDMIIANPNCSTIQMVVALQPLHKRYGIKRVVVSTYQSVTGTGKAAVDQLMAERAGEKGYIPVYPHRIDLNVLPHIDVFLENGYTKEEMKMVNETCKIMQDDAIKVTATAVRIPVMGGHSESVNVELKQDFDLGDVRALWSETPGLIVQDDPANNLYPMPLTSHRRNEVFVGRLRRDESQANSLNFWVVADNLRKGAATNAVQIVEVLYSKGWIG